MEIDDILSKRQAAQNSEITKVYSKVLSPSRSCETVLTTFLNPIPDERLNICAPFAYNAQLTTVRTTPFLSSNLCGINFAPLAAAPMVLGTAATNSFVLGYFGQAGLDRRELPKPDQAGDRGALYPMPFTADSGANAGLVWQFTVPSLSVRTESPVHRNHCGAELPSTALTFSYSGNGVTFRAASLNLDLLHGINQSIPGVNANTRAYLEGQLSALERYIQNYKNQTEPQQHDSATGAVQPTERINTSANEEQLRQERLRQLATERQRIEDEIRQAANNVDEHQRILREYIQQVKAAWGTFTVPPPQQINNTPPEFDFGMASVNTVNLDFDQQPTITFSSIPSLVSNKLDSGGVGGGIKIPLMQQITKFVSSLTGFQVPTDLNAALTQGISLIGSNGQGQRLFINQFAQLGSAIPLALSKEQLELLGLPDSATKIVGTLLPLLKDPTAFLRDPSLLLEGFLTAFNIQGADAIIKAVGKFIKSPNLESLLNVSLLVVPQKLIGPIAAIYEAYNGMIASLTQKGAGRLRSVRPDDVSELVTVGLTYPTRPATIYAALQQPALSLPVPPAPPAALPKTTPSQTTVPQGLTAAPLNLTSELYVLPTSEQTVSTPAITAPSLPDMAQPLIFETPAANPTLPDIFNNQQMPDTNSEYQTVVGDNINPLPQPQPTLNAVFSLLRMRMSVFSLGVCPGIAKEISSILDELRHYSLQGDPNVRLNDLLVDYFITEPFDLHGALIDYNLLADWITQQSPESAAYLRSLINGDIVDFFRLLIQRHTGIDLAMFPAQLNELRRLVNGIYELGVDPTHG